MIKEKKPEFEPWDKKELAIMNLSLGQEENKRLTNLAEIRKIKQGLVDIHKEINANVGQAELQLKTAQMNVDDLKFDRDNKITLNRLKLKSMELKNDVERGKVNIKNFKLQIKAGKPKQEVAPMSEEPIIEPTPEEKDSKQKLQDEENAAEKTPEKEKAKEKAQDEASDEAKETTADVTADKKKDEKTVPAEPEPDSV